MTISIALILAGFVLLYFGADWLVNGAANLAVKVGISQLVVGLTVVAFGTSAPELVVSLDAALNAHGDIAIGNVTGSNIFNLAFILGIASLICPIAINRQILRFDAPVMIIASIVFSLMILDGKISRPEALLLFSGILAYTGYLIVSSKKSSSSAQEESKEQNAPEIAGGSIAISIFYVLAGLITLVLGSRLLVEGAVAVAKILKISEAVIGLTIVAAGTSLPELATSVVAAFKKNADISIGNVVGSNIFNILCIIGLAGTVAPMSFPGISNMDIGFMLGTAILIYPFMLSGKILNRTEGGILLAIYVAYIAVLWPK